MAAWLKQVLFLVLTVLIVFSPALSVYFVQDDFGHLLGSNVQKPLDSIQWLAPHAHDGFYRPLGVYVPIGILQLVFGLTPSWYHSAALALHSVNAILLTFLLRTLSVKPSVSLIIAILYAAHPAHVYALSWIAEFSLILFIFWVLIILITVVKQSQRTLLSTSLLTTVALLTSEFAVVLPVLVFLFIRMTKIHLPHRNFLAVWLPVLIYFPIRFIALRPEVTAPYQPDLSPLVSGVSIAWYAQRTLGLPDYAGLVNALTNVQIFPFTLPLFTSLALMLISIRLRLRIMGITGVWWLVSLAPVLFLPNHRLSSYLALSLVGVCIALGLQVKNARFLTASILLFVTSAAISTRINWEKNWMVRRAKLAQSASALLIPLASNPPASLHIQTLPAQSREAYFALGVDAGPKVLTGNENLTVTYSAFHPNPPRPNTYTITVPVLE